MLNVFSLIVHFCTAIQNTGFPKPIIQLFICSQIQLKFSCRLFNIHAVTPIMKYILDAPTA